jgi:two-component system, LuxR family, response regulator FixJ
VRAEGIVYIVDDDEAVCQSLERMLRTAGFATVTYGSGIAFLDAAAAGLAPGCLLLDMWMPGMDGLDVQSRMGERGLRHPVVVMTGHGDVLTAVRAMKAGAVDFIEKPFIPHALLKAIEVALAGRERRAQDREAAQAAERIAMLSPREREVLDSLAAGRSNKIIAFDLNLSVRTVEVHRARMLDRLGTHSSAAAVRLVVLATRVS